YEFLSAPDAPRLLQQSHSVVTIGFGQLTAGEEVVAVAVPLPQNRRRRQSPGFLVRGEIGGLDRAHFPATTDQKDADEETPSHHRSTSGQPGHLPAIDPAALPSEASPQTDQ